MKLGLSFAPSFICCFWPIKLDRKNGPAKIWYQSFLSQTNATAKHDLMVQCMFDHSIMFHPSIFHVCSSPESFNACILIFASACTELDLTSKQACIDHNKPPMPQQEPAALLVTPKKWQECHSTPLISDWSTCVLRGVICTQITNTKIQRDSEKSLYLVLRP